MTHPEPRFRLFGMGPDRRKVLYRQGRVSDALTGEVLAELDVQRATYLPESYALRLETRQGEALLSEDGEAVWLERGGERRCLTRGSRVVLPRFAGEHAALLSELHAELLVSLMPCGPVPNIWVYPRPWYRDAAMVLMALSRTGNLSLVEPWVAGLERPFDRNNDGAAEPDNLGQLLYMISLTADVTHPLVSGVLKEARERTRDGHLVGLTDGAPHPVYQTKWLKFGLRALGLADEWVIPAVPDSYSSLFWMDYRTEHVAAGRFAEESAKLYPYLGWAEAHFHGDPPPFASPPLSGITSWEASASQAEYWRLRAIDAELAAARMAAPHTWHAAEMFLYLLERAQPST
jgi:hypothetical protein